MARARRMIAAGVALLVAGAAVAAMADGAGSEPAVAMVLSGMSGRAVPPAAAPGTVSFEGTGLVDRRGWADVDGDGVADRVEEALCGSATCAMPWADVDGNGVSDAVDVLVCGAAGCVDPTRDEDGDGIPDFVGVLLCGQGGCPPGTLRGDVDGDGVENWVEALIAGDAISATGLEDLDGDGIADAAALMACLRVSPLATTGAEVWWLLAAACLAGGTGLVLRGWRDLRVDRALVARGAAA